MKTFRFTQSQNASPRASIHNLRNYQVTINYMKHIQTTTLAASIACLTTTAIAHGDPNKPHSHNADLGTTTVVASRSVKDSSRVTSQLYIADVDALKDQGIGDFATALSYVPGSIISSSGQQGTIQGIRLRGLHPRHTQIRVDGVRLTSRQFGLQSFIGQGSLIGYSRLELLQGPQSALYGSGATGGVVNLTTKKGADNAYNRVRLEAGSFNSLSLETEQSGSLGKLNYYLFSRYSTTDNDTYGDNSETGTFDNDYVSNTSGLRLDYLATSDLELGLTFRMSDSTIETPQFGGSRTENEFILGTIYADYAINENWQSKLTFSYLVENTDFVSSGSGNDYDQFGISWENSLRYSDQGTLSFGAEYENQDYTGFGVTSGRKDHYSAIYLNHSYQLANLTLDAGARFEDYQSFGSNTSWHTGAKYEFKQSGTSISANIGTGFNTPTLLQLFSPTLFGITGNPNLNPEESLGWDISVKQKFGNHTASLTFFETDVKDAIVRDFGAGTFVNTPGKAKASGIEAALKGKISEQVRYNLGYTWLDRSIDRQPEQVVNAQVVFKPTAKIMLGLGAQYLDQRFYGGSHLKDALIVRAFGSYQLTDSIKLHARIENLTDTEYNQVSFFGTDFPARRLGVHAGFTYEW